MFIFTVCRYTFLLLLFKTDITIVLTSLLKQKYHVEIVKTDTDNMKGVKYKLSCQYCDNIYEVQTNKKFNSE